MIQEAPLKVADESDRYMIEELYLVKLIGLSSFIFQTLLD